MLHPSMHVLPPNARKQRITANNNFIFALPTEYCGNLRVCELIDSASGMLPIPQWRVSLTKFSNFQTLKLLRLKIYINPTKLFNLPILALHP